MLASHKGWSVTRERLGLAPRLVGLLGLIALAAWAFSGSHQQPGPEERRPSLVVKAQPAPEEPVSAEPQPSPSSSMILQPPKAAQTAEPLPATIITLRPPYDVVDVRTIRAGGRTITLAGIEGFGQDASCRARDGTRWSCAKLARDALRGRVGSQSLRCSTEAQATAVVFVALCTTSRSEDLARTLVADGWARVLDDARQRYGAEAKAAEEQGLGLWGWQMEGRSKRR
jgi:endonuclease YncB( thermonuclease family)